MANTWWIVERCSDNMYRIIASQIPRRKFTCFVVSLLVAAAVDFMCMTEHEWCVTIAGFSIRVHSYADVAFIFFSSCYYNIH